MTGGFRPTTFLMAAFSHWHEWLPVTPNRNIDNFVSILKEAKISRVGFLRHGQTGPTQEGGFDFDRLLTDNGRQQAMQAGLAFGKSLKPFYASLLVSPAPRTMETAKLFLDIVDSRVDVQLVPRQALYDGTMQPKGSALFRKVGYAPLRDYLDHEEEQDRKDARHLLGAYAHSVAENMIDVVQESGASEADCTLWMIGHAIYLPAAALGVASLVGCEDVEVILSSNTMEAEGYLIDMQLSSVDYLSRGEEGA